MNRIAWYAGLVAIAALLAPSGMAHAAQTIRCESVSGNYQTCSVNTQGGVQLSRQLSSQGCWENDTWGYDRNRIWVTNGCRADFSVGNAQSSGSGNGAVVGAIALGLIGAAIIANKNHDRNDNGNGNGYNPSYTVRCESNNNRYQRCPLRGRGQVEVYRQLSDNNCRYGSSWGVEGRTLWVSNGCRADFAMY
jgi:hypothetical protein